MVFKHRRGRRDAGNFGIDQALVVAREEIVAVCVADRAGPAAGILYLDHVGADALDQFLNVILAGKADGRHQDQRGRSNDHAEGRQRKT